MQTVIEGAHVLTVAGDEYPDGHVVVVGNRIAAVGAGPAPEWARTGRVVDGRGCLLTPGLVNCHHHLYQWVTRGLAVDHTLFEWLTTLYPVWAGIDEDAVRTGASGALATLALSGCTTSTDHHYVFPREGGDVLGAEIRAAAEVGLRFHPTRGSMDLGRSAGGLPPDHVVEDRDTILAACADAVARWHDPSFDSMLRIALAPCSPFSVTGELMRESAQLARELGVRLHTHLAETDDEEEFCAERFGCTPTQYVADLGWTGDDVWFAHTVHLDDAAVKTIGATGTGVSHCPTSNGRLGAGIARVRDLVDAGARVGLGVDGAASNEGTSLLEDVKLATLFARARGGPRAMSVRQAVELGTLGGARVLGREDEIGTIETGKLADLALWRLDDLGHAGIADPVAALVLGAAPPLELLLVNGRPVVEHDRVVTVDTEAVAARCASVQRDLVAKAG
ncbi:8-oxoguanine deaminase [Pseudonocardia phyllosphaerae]|uniref:8-oxoguanine deaminase n=1 Tax=Pseudonocardia phyllosphaerae TaxID=3390502 RepID=UPI00397A5929